MATRVVRQEPLVVALPSGHALARRRVVDPRDLSGQPFVAFPRPRCADLHDAVTDACQDAGFVPRVAQEAAELLTQAGLVAAGMGVALVPDSARRLRHEGVVYRSLLGRPPAPETVLAWRRGGQMPALRAFLRGVEPLAEGPDRGRDSGRAAPRADGAPFV